MPSSSSNKTAYIGIDLGNDQCCVAAYNNSDVDIITDDYSARETPSYVAFCGNERLMGMGAKHQAAANLTNTVCGIKRLLGVKHLNDYNQYVKLPFRLSETDSGVIIGVEYGGRHQQLLPEQFLAMLFTKFKQWTKMKLNADEVMCVISVPSYFTNQQRSAILNSAHIAGLGVARLLSDTAAICFTYGWHLSPVEERNVAFVDMGNTSLQVSVCRVNHLGARVLALQVDPNLGGRDFDIRMAIYLLKQFCEAHNIEANLSSLVNEGTYYRLLEKVEEIKKKISINKATFPIKLENFVKDNDLVGQLSRSIMEELCGDLIERARAVMMKCLNNSGLQMNAIQTVEATGGSTRIPAIKLAIETVFGSLSSTINKNEAIASGCALQCASYNLANLKQFRVRDQLCHEISLYIDDTRLIDFPSDTITPFTRQYRLSYKSTKHPDLLKAVYSNEDVGSQPTPLGEWRLGGGDPGGARGAGAGHKGGATLDMIVKVDKNGLLEYQYNGSYQRNMEPYYTYKWEALRHVEDGFRLQDEEEEETAAARNSLEEFIYQNVARISHSPQLLQQFESTLQDIRRRDYRKQFYTETKQRLQEALSHHTGRSNITGNSLHQEAQAQDKMEVETT